jgi:hypothetical protein
MTQEKINTTDCEIKMSNMERLLRRYFWTAIVIITGMLGSAFTWYDGKREAQVKKQEEKVNKIATASIKSDERLDKRITLQEERQIQSEKNQAVRDAKGEINMKWIMDSCSRIETRQTRLEAKLEKSQ